MFSNMTRDKNKLQEVKSMSVSVRVFYNGRDFFGGLVWDQDAARDVSTVAEGEKLIARCMARLGLGGRGSIVERVPA